MAKTLDFERTFLHTCPPVELPPAFVLPSMVTSVPEPTDSMMPTCSASLLMWSKLNSTTSPACALLTDTTLPAFSALA